MNFDEPIVRDIQKKRTEPVTCTDLSRRRVLRSGSSLGGAYAGLMTKLTNRKYAGTIMTNEEAIATIERAREMRLNLHLIHHTKNLVFVVNVINNTSISIHLMT